VLLGQVLGLHEWTGIAVVVLANAVAVVTSRGAGAPLPVEEADSPPVAAPAVP
jgi:inner membrane transporter RhtA